MVGWVLTRKREINVLVRTYVLYAIKTKGMVEPIVKTAKISYRGKPSKQEKTTLFVLGVVFLMIVILKFTAQHAPNQTYLEEENIGVISNTLRLQPMEAVVIVAEKPEKYFLQ